MMKEITKNHGFLRKFDVNERQREGRIKMFQFILDVFLFVAVMLMIAGVISAFDS